MSFTSPPDLAKVALNQPDTSADIIRPRKLGTVHCINVARLGEPITLRYFGASAVAAATGQAHPTQAQAEADVLAWADGKEVPYEKHGGTPLGCQAVCSKKFAPPADAEKMAKLNEDVLYNLKNGPTLVQNGVSWVSLKQAVRVFEQLTKAGAEVLAKLHTAEAQVASLTEQLAPGSPSSLVTQI